YEDEVIFFEHKDYDGYYLRQGTNIDASNLTLYGLEDPFTNTYVYNWNDRISSMKIGAKACVTTYTNINYGGQRWQVRANGNNTHYVSDSAPLGCGDNTSSFRVRDRDHCVW
ncbi:MAG: hypothetical protein WBC06_08110, partial [Chitinophagaceae bacterium]